MSLAILCKLHPLIQSGFEQIFIEGLVCARQCSSCLGFFNNKTKITALLRVRIVGFGALGLKR